MSDEIAEWSWLTFFARLNVRLGGVDRGQGGTPRRGGEVKTQAIQVWDNLGLDSRTSGRGDGCEVCLG